MHINLFAKTSIIIMAKHSKNIAWVASSTSITNKENKVKQRRKLRKFTEEEIQLVRGLYVKNQYSLWQIADMTRMSKSTVWHLTKDINEQNNHPLQSNDVQAGKSVQANNRTHALSSPSSFKSVASQSQTASQHYKKTDDEFQEMMAGMDKLTVGTANLLKEEERLRYKAKHIW